MLETVLSGLKTLKTLKLETDNWVWVGVFPVSEGNES